MTGRICADCLVLEVYDDTQWRHAPDCRPEFSRAPCDKCGTTAPGNRHQVTQGDSRK